MFQTTSQKHFLQYWEDTSKEASSMKQPHQFGDSQFHVISKSKKTSGGLPLMLIFGLWASLHGPVSPPPTWSERCGNTANKRSFGIKTHGLQPEETNRYWNICLNMMISPYCRKNPWSFGVWVCLKMEGTRNILKDHDAPMTIHCTWDSGVLFSNNSDSKPNRGEVRQ